MSSTSTCPWCPELPMTCERTSVPRGTVGSTITAEVRMATKDEGGQQRASRKSQEVEETEDLDTADAQERHDKLSEDVDDILDEIDSVLEENAEDFVRGYVQKGGQ